MAKVMVSFPDDLLERFDEHARSLGKSRSGLLQELAECELAARRDRRSEAIRALLDSAGPLGGDAVELIRADRRSH